jgi:hypothetical protein
MVFAEAKTHAKTIFVYFFIPRAKARGYKALTLLKPWQGYHEDLFTHFIK